MNPFLSFPRTSLGTLIEPLGWALVHSFWQILVVAATAAFVVRLMRHRSAQARYVLLLVALAVAVIWPVATFALLPAGAPLAVPGEAAALDEGAKETVPPNYSQPISVIEPFAPKAHVWEPTLPAGPQSDQAESSSSAAEPVVSIARSWAETTQAVLRPHLGWLVGAWILGMVLCSLRPLLGWFTLERLRRVGVSQVPEEILELLNRVSGRLGLRRVVSIKQSVLATVPVVIGYLRPTILLPLSVLGHMPVSQLEAIIAHELAHVRRHDFLCNLIQTLIETLFFYHPAIWWLSHRIRIEREHCCDDLVVGMLGNRVAYGRALIAVEQLRGPTSILALGATDGSLLARIRRIVGSPTAGASASSWSLPGLVIFSACAFLLMSLLPWKGTSQANAAETHGEEPPGISSPVSNEVESLVGDESKLPASLRVVGRIVDDETGKPIERAAFQGGRFLPGNPGKVEWGYSFTYGERLQNGEFAQTLNWSAHDRRRVLAPGYEPASILDELPSALPNPPVVERTIRLKKGRLVQGTLRNHLGQGVANGQVFFIPEGHRANIINGVPGLDSPGSHGGSIDHSVTQVKTDAEGRFEMPAGGNGILAASSEQVDLWPFATPAEGQSADLTLPKPGQLKIDLAHWYLDDMAKKAGEKSDSAPEDPNRILLHVYRMDGSDNLWKKCAYGGNLLVFAEDAKAPVARNVRIGPIDRSQKPALIEGKWQNRSLSTQMLVNLPPGHYQIHRYREGERSPQATMIEIKSGEVASLDWARAEGAAVIGSVALPANSQFVRQEGEAPRKLDWTIPHNGYVLIYSRQGASKNETLEVAKIQKDGSFQIPTHLPPGTYQASAWAWLPESDQSRQFSGLRLMPGLTAEKEFTIPKPPSSPSGAAPVRLQLTMEPRSHQIVTNGKPAQPTEKGDPDAFRELSEDEVSKRVLVLLRKPYNPDFTRGSWQGGAFEAEMFMNLAQLQPKDLVVKTLMKVIEGKEPSSFQQRRLALLHVAGAAPEQLLPYLIQDLGGKDSSSVDASGRVFMMHEIEALNRMGEDARTAIPVLTKKLKDPNWDLSEQAIHALVKVGPQSPEVITALSGRFDRPRAVYEAARFGELAKPLGPTFAGLLDSENKEISTWAAFGLVKSGFNPSLGLDFLVKQAEQGKAVPHDLALIALGALGSDAKSAIEKLRSLAKDPSESFAREVNRTIDRIEKNDRILTHAEEAAKTTAARKAAREAVEKLQAAQARRNAPPTLGLEFLASYPKLRELSLAMTEKEFLEIAWKEKLKLHVDLGKEGSKYQLATGDGHTLIVMFRNYGEPCTGIQRIRGGEAKEPAQSDRSASETSSRPNDLKFTGQLRSVPLKAALEWLANAAGLKLHIDENEVKQAKLNLDRPVNLVMTDESPTEIFDRLIDWKNYGQNGILHEIQGGKLIVSTWDTNRKAIRNQLPDWLAVHYDQGRGRGVELDEHNQVMALSVSGNALSEQYLKRLTALPKLARLRIYESNRWTAAMLDQLANFPHLQDLEVSGIKYEGKDLGDEAIKRIVKLKSLLSLTIRSCGVTDSGVKELEELRSLRSLTLGSERLLTDNALISIAKMTHLKSLDLDARTFPYYPFGFSGAEGGNRLGSFTEEGLRKLTSIKDLEELNLSGRPLSPAVLNFPNLRSLNLSRSTVDDACAAKIAQLHQLQSLVFRGSRISNEGLKVIAKLPNLNTLVLESETISDEGIDYLQSLKRLREISIKNNRLNDASLKSLSKISSLCKIELGNYDANLNSQRSINIITVDGIMQLNNLPHLRALELSNVQLKDGYWGLKKFSRLNELVLNSDNISIEEIDVLEESLPGTRISGRGHSFQMRSQR